MTTAQSAAATAFDELAHEYDRTFTDTVIGGRMRVAVHRRLRALFPAGSTVLELNCGTGADAVWLAAQGVNVVATDLSAEMVETTRRRALRVKSSLNAELSVAQVAIEDVSARFRGEQFDGVLSNFGGLNCVDSMGGAASSIAPLVRPGGRALLCVMGPWVPWEWVWFAGRGDFGAARRRLRSGGTIWRGVRITYPTIDDTRKAFSSTFSVDRVWALGALVPPPYTERSLLRIPGASALIGALDAVERRVEAVPGVARLADHYVVELTRR